jgi:hypothetical protein
MVVSCVPRKANTSASGSFAGTYFRRAPFSLMNYLSAADLDRHRSPRFHLPAIYYSPARRPDQDVSLQFDSGLREEGAASMLSEYQRNYVRDQSTGEILGNTFEIYKDFFSEIFFPYFVIVGLPTIIWSLLGEWFLDVQPKTVYWVSICIALFTTMLASAVITVVVSRICLGDYPRVGEAISHISGKLWMKLLVTNVAYYLAAGLLLYLLDWSGALDWAVSSLFGYLRNVTSIQVISVIFPLLFRALFLLMSISFIFYPIIVVLEGRWGFNAFKRSVTLGWGYHLRDYGVQFVLLFLTYVVSVIVGVMFGFLAATMQSPGAFLIFTLLAIIINLILAPLNLVCLVLLYYDVRVRKEAYSNAALALELRH